MVGRTNPSNSDNQNGDGGGLVCARVYVCACVCVHACVRDVFAIYYNNILPRLIIIIIKIIILYFIEIAHTDDFPSTGTRLVTDNSVSYKNIVLLGGLPGFAQDHFNLFSLEIVAFPRLLMKWLVLQNSVPQRGTCLK